MHPINYVGNASAIKMEESIRRFIECDQCMKDVPEGTSMEDWSRLKIGVTGGNRIQIWCNRHDREIYPEDFFEPEHRKHWFMSIPPNEIEDLATKPEFIQILRLGRFVNQINFCLEAMSNCGADEISLLGVLNGPPIFDREENNSTWLLLAVLCEAFKGLQEIETEFNHYIAFRRGFTAFFAAPEVEAIKPILKRMRNQQVFHVDAKIVRRILSDLDIESYNLVAATQRDQSELRADEVCFPLSDVIALNHLIGSSDSLKEGLLINQDVIATVVTAAKHFVKCALHLINDYVITKGWCFDAYDDDDYEPVGESLSMSSLLDRLKASLSFEFSRQSEMNPEWLERLRKNGFTSDTVFSNGRYEDLKTKLLEKGGVAVLLTINLERKYLQLLHQGQWFDNSNTHLVREFGYVHNSLTKLRSVDPTIQIYAGFALGSDSLWRFHEWGVQGGNTIEVSEFTSTFYYGIDNSEDDFFGNSSESQSAIK